VIRHASLHRRGNAKRLVHAGEIVVQVVQRDCRRVVLNLLENPFVRRVNSKCGAAPGRLLYLRLAAHDLRGAIARFVVARARVDLVQRVAKSISVPKASSTALKYAR